MCSIKSSCHHHQNTPSNSSRSLDVFSPSTLLYCSLDLILPPLRLGIWEETDFSQGLPPPKMAHSLSSIFGNCVGYFYCKLRSLPTALSPRRGAHPGGKLDLGWLSSTLFMFLPGTPVTKTDYERKA